MLELNNVHIDHVIPESYTQRPELVNILKDLELNPDYDLNSPENLVPVHSHCNLQKGDLIYKSSSIRHYHEVAKSKYPAISKLINDFRQKAQTDTQKAKVLGSIEKGIVEPEAVWSVLRGTGFAPEDLLDVSDIIDDLAQLMKTHNYSQAIAALEQVKKNRWRQLSDQARYKLTLNYGIAYFNLDEKLLGAEYFIELQNYASKDDAAALGFIALGYAIKEDFTNAAALAEKSLTIDPENQNAALALVFIHKGNITPATLDQLIPVALQKIPVVGINIGLALDKRKYLAEAFRIYQDLDNSYEQIDIVKCEILSQLANNRILTLSLKGAHWLGQFNQEDKDLLLYALEKFNGALEIIKNTEYAASKWYLLTNRGVVKRALQDKAGAIADFNASLQLRKSFLTYRHLFNLCQEDKGKAEELIAEMEGLFLTDQERQQLLISKAQLALQHRQISDELISAFTVELESITSAEERLFWLNILVELLLARKLVDNAMIFATQMIEDEFGASSGHVIRAKIYHLNKDSKEKIIQELDAANSKLGTTADIITVVDIADMLMLYKDYQKAIAVLLPHTDIHQCSELTRKLLKAYFGAGNHKRCIEIAEPLLAEDENNTFLIEYLVQIYDAAGLYRKAIELLEKQLSEGADERQIRVNLALLHTKVEEFESALKLVENIVDFKGIPLSFQFLIVDIFEKSGNYAKASSLALQIRNDKYNDGEAHHYYCNYMFKRRRKAEMEPKPAVIGLNTFFKIDTDDAKTIEKVIVAQASRHNEIDPSSGLYQKVLGKELGDTIVFGGDDYKVINILSIEAHALQDSLAQIEIFYGDQSPIKSFKVRPDSGGDLLHQMRKAITPFLEEAKRLEDFYKEGITTIGCNATILGMSPYKYWQKLTRTPEPGIYSLDDNETIRASVTSFKEGASMVIDLTALLSLFYIDGLKLLELFSSQMYISSLTVAHIEAEIAELAELKTGQFVSHTEEVNGKVVTTFEEQAELESRYQSMHELLEVIKRRCDIISPEISEDFFNDRERNRTLGASFNATARIAKDKNAILYADDQVFKVLIRNEQVVSCMSTLVLLELLTNDSKMSLAENRDYLYRLALLNYREVPMSADILYKIVVHNSRLLTRQVMNSLDMLSSLYCDTPNVLGILIEFLYMLYSTNRVIGPRTDIAEYAVAKAFSGRNVAKMKEALLFNLKRKFSVLPLEYNELKRVINKFF
ncbi:PIN domain-containing protein [Chitinophaga ginsengisoli]